MTDITAKTGEGGNVFDDFINLYGLSKTLRFELVPQGKTLDWIKERHLIEQDAQRAEDYKLVKTLMDRHHREFIDGCLEGLRGQLDWEPLADAVRTCREAEDWDARAEAYERLGEEQESMRAVIAGAFAKADGFKDLWTKDLVNEILPKEIEGDENEAAEFAALGSFKAFTGYFTGFNENRRNLYSPEAQTTAIAYRIVNVNFGRFFEDVSLFEQARERFPEAIEEAQAELDGRLSGVRLEDVLFADNYGAFVTQKGVTLANDLIGGWNEEGGKKVKGLNECLYEAYQQGDGEGSPIRLLPLYKQLLAETEQTSFHVGGFADDAEMAEAIRAFDGGMPAALAELSKALSGIEFADLEHVYVPLRNVPVLSIAACGRWDALPQAIDHCREMRVGPCKGMTKAQAASFAKPARSAGRSGGYLSLADAESCLAAAGAPFMGWARLADEAKKRAAAVADARPDAFKAIEGAGKGTRLQQSEGKVAAVKSYLDAALDAFHLAKLLDAPAELERDGAFYGELDAAVAGLSGTSSLYDATRNRLTQKPFSRDQFKLNFGCPTLGNGWDVNKERTNSAILLRRDGKYYVGILAAGSKPPKDAFADDPEADDFFEKINYKLLPNVPATIPRVTLGRKGVERFHPSLDIIEGYAEGKHKKGASFDVGFMRTLVDYFKDCIAEHEDWSVFGFKFSDTSEYENIGDFYKEVAAQGYKIWFTRTSTANVDELVDDGRLYLFQLNCRDYMPGAHGKKNLHTLYWESVFDPRNLEDVRFKLSGGAQVFYRPASIKRPYAHKVGSKVVNRWMTMPDGSSHPLPEDVHKEIFDFVNGKAGKLSETARKYYNSGFVTVKDVQREIVKDKRFTEDKFFFHVPIALNYRAKGNDFINYMVNERLADGAPMNVIGIDRGERNLLYATVVDPNGRIIEQRSLNVVGDRDYRAKLQDRERLRNEQRRSWKSVSGIKDLKTGYLSQAVKEIVDMMVEYRAIVVLEDLSSNFKRSRVSIEKSVYQNFEKQLIDKLNYCVVTKDESKSDQPGGVLRGYQLASKFTSFEMLGKQSGFLFYLPASWTESLDPTTGFACLFPQSMLRYRSVSATKDFFSRFESIRFNPESGLFEFSFRYSNFPLRVEDGRDEWTVCATHAKRTRYAKNDKGAWRPVPADPAGDLARAFEGTGYKDGHDLKDDIADMDSKAKLAGVLEAFRTLVTLRCDIDGVMHIVSPVRNAAGRFYDSHERREGLPLEADANSAYNIARKGVMVLQEGLFAHNGKGYKVDLGRDQSHDWLAWAQGHCLEG